MPYIQISNLVPLNFTQKGRTLDAIYNFKHFDGWQPNEQLAPWESAPAWHQKWQKNDIIFFQVKCDFDPIYIDLINDRGWSVRQIQLAVVRQIGTDFYLQGQLALDNIPEGCYTIELSAGTPILITLESNEIEVKEQQPGTLLYKYSNNMNDKNILFETGIYFLFRVEGYIKKFVPVTSRVVFIDNPFNAKTVQGVTARSFTLYAGEARGLPDYMVDKLNDIFTLTNVEIDGKGFSALESGTKWVPAREEGYGWSGWTLEVTETLNRRAKRFETTGVVDKRVLIDYIVEGKLFGPTRGSANDNTYTINEIE
jgi:hypothetical protein